MQNQEPTNFEILQAINDYAGKNDGQWAKNEERWAKNEERWAKNEERLNRIEATMVTKDYLDDKLADLKGDLIVLMRKEDAKLKALIEILQRRHVISGDEAKGILSMQPFPQLSL